MSRSCPTSTAEDAKAMAPIALRDSGLDDRYSGGYGAAAGNGESPRLRNGEGSGLPADAEDFEQVSKDS